MSRAFHRTSTCRLRPGALWLAALAIGGFLLATTTPAAAHTTAPPASSRAAVARNLTDALTALAARYRAATSGIRASLESQLLTAASVRQSFLASLIEDDPDAVLQVALSSSVRSRLPAILTPHLEQEIRVEGTFEILHEDRADGSRFRYFVDSPSGRFSLHFASHAPDHLLTGAKVRVRGVQIDNMLALGGSGSVEPTAPPPLPNTLGAQRTVVLLVNFMDNPVQPYTVDDARSAIFGTTSAFFFENSYQQAWLDGNVFGWFTIPLGSGTCDYASIASHAQSAAVAAGLDLSTYSHRVFAFPKTTACAWWGLSSIGGNPSRTWINGAFEMTVLSHELGHSLGLYHSHALDCGNASIGNTLSATYPPPAGTCYTIEYGDLIDAMGGAYPGHFNAFQKERLGWLNAEASPPVTTVTASGTYPLEALAIQSGSPKALKILRSQDPTTGARTWYYVEARRPIGFDGVIDTTASTVGIVSTIPQGVLVHVGTDGSGNSGSLIDMHPAADTSIWDWLLDAPLLVGESFSDVDAGLTLTTEAVSGTGAAVAVRLAPTVSTFAAITVSTDQTSYTRGQSATITAKVTSNGKPLANASVTFQVVKPTGALIIAKATTSTKGTATYKLRLAKQDPVGTYQADANAVKGTQSASAATTFVVK
jgi:hypothetical protein